MESSLAMTSHKAKDSFDLKNSLDQHCPTGTTFSTCNIKHYIETFNMIFFMQQAVEYWIAILQNDLLLLQRFSEQFIIEGLPIILEFNYFYINEFIFFRLKEPQWGQNLQLVVVI